MKHHSDIRLCYGRGTARHACQQKLSHPKPIMWHYLRDPTFSRFHTIPESDRHTRTDRQKDGQIHDDGMHSVAR